MSERGFFFIFLIFCYFFRNFLARVKYERNSGPKFFSLFLCLSHPVLAKNNAEMRFFNFFANFFWNFVAQVEYERNSGLKFFSLILGLSHPSLYRNSVRMMFLNFLVVFFGNGSPVRVGTKPGTKIFFSLSRPLSTHLDWNNVGIKFPNFLNFFSIFFGIFLPGSSISGIRA